MNEVSDSLTFHISAVAVVEGRTRSLVERFEKRETFNTDEAQTPDTIPHEIQEADKASPMLVGYSYPLPPPPPPLPSLYIFI